MNKQLTNELRWLYRNDKMVLQQRWYFRWSNESVWEDVPAIVESRNLIKIKPNIQK